MYFFDWADPPLLLAKCFKYLSDEELVEGDDDEPSKTTNKDKDDTQNIALRQLLSTWTNRLFEIFAVVFFLTRNMLYSYVVYFVLKDLKRDGTMPGAATCQTLCVILVALQTYWFGLIVQAVRRQSKSKDGKIQDVRENNKNKQKTK